MTANACCICSVLLDTYDEKTEKPIIPERRLACCDRVICTRCIMNNTRYKTYCPYCQITNEPSLLPQGLRDPPSYSDLEKQQPPPPQDKHDEAADELPPYSAHQPIQPLTEKANHEEAPDVLHFLTPTDTLQSLSLAYGVPLNALRRTNNVFADHLVLGRKTVLIPGEYYKGGVSLSPQPMEGEEQEIKKNKVRRWMVACKVSEYDVALLYLEQADYDLDSAIQAYQDDERWEKEHPLDKKGKNKQSAKSVGMRRYVGSRSNANGAADR